MLLRVHSVPATHENVLGVLSLIIYSLLLVISVSYIAIVMRADNEGEGGILALTALLPERTDSRGHWSVLVLMGIFGAALLYGDGMITPAITVLGAVEGLKVATPLFESSRRARGRRDPDRGVRDSEAWHAPRRPILRTDHGRVVCGDCRARHRVAAREPVVLTAIDPRHAVSFFREHGWHGFAVLGAVFLVVTGGEALCGHGALRQTADSGRVVHARPAGAPPELLWPGALLLTNPPPRSSRFFSSHRVGAVSARRARDDAAIIASQALISGAFSLTSKPFNSYCPRLDIEHTSHSEMGQVYVPQVNWALMVSTIVIVIGFGSSTALAAAYGIAVTLTMVITAVLLQVVATERGSGRRRRIDGDGHLSDDRSGVFRRERPEDHPRRLAAARHRRSAVHADDDVEDRTQSRGSAFDRARRAKTFCFESSRRGPRAFRARPCS